MASLLERNQREVNQVPVRQKDKWKEILDITKHKPISVGWAVAHQKGSNLTNQVDSLTRLAVMVTTGEGREVGTFVRVVAH